MDSDDDVTNVKVTTSTSKPKKATTWVTSSFDNFMSSSSSEVGVNFPKSQPKLRRSQNDQFSQSQRQIAGQAKISSLMPDTKLPKTQATSHPGSSSFSRKRQLGDDFPPHRLTSLVKSDSQRRKFRSAVNTELWSDKYQPKRKDELAVHKKKVEEITMWLKERTWSFARHSAPILLLTGSPGSGKTATVRAIAAELKLAIHEWANPTLAASGDSDFTPMNPQDWSERSSVEVFKSQSQSSQFTQYLLRANKYQALKLDFGHDACSLSAEESCQKKFILVEDIPNAFYRDPAELHDILRRYRRCGHCPLVFIISDTSNSCSSVQRLFPPNIQDELCLHVINVNPVAPTMMVKVLNKIASQEASQGHFTIPSARVVESIAMSSAGDVRSAINALQFACRQDTIDLSKLRTAEKHLKKVGSSSGRRLKYGSLSKKDSSGAEAPDMEHQAAIGAKDTTCFLFHALGKILYFKRGNPADFPCHQILPAHLKHFDRDPLLLTPEEVVEKTHVGGDFFNTFLHQNYLQFMSTVEDVDRAADYLSTADKLSAQYSNRGQLQDYSVSVASRGFIHSESSICHHTDSRTGQGWRPLHKSPWFSTQKQCQQSHLAAVQLFRGYHWDPEILLTEIVPYINLTNPTLHDPGQIAFVQNLCLFSKSPLNRLRLENLEEKGAVDDESEEEGSLPVLAQASDTATANALAAVSLQSGKVLGPDDKCDVDDIPSSQNTVKNTPVEVEEKDDFVIEEFED